MERQRRHQRRPCQIGYQNRQFDFFAPEPPTGLAPTLDWSALPEETRRELTGLMARLFVGHAGGGADDHQEGADDL
jgi:hypothetical protein